MSMGLSNGVLLKEVAIFQRCPPVKLPLYTCVSLVCTVSITLGIYGTDIGKDCHC